MGPFLMQGKNREASEHAAYSGKNEERSPSEVQLVDRRAGGYWPGSLGLDDEEV